MAHIFSAAHWMVTARGAWLQAGSALLRVVAVVLVYAIVRFVLLRSVEVLLAGLIRREQRIEATALQVGRLETIRSLLRSVVNYILIFTFGVLLLKAVGFDMLPFITTAGVVGLAVGFGSQKLVKDVISGFFMILDQQYVVGETVTIAGFTGLVQELGMRSTRILDSSGRVVIFANGDIGTVVNLSRHPVMDPLEISVAANTDLQKLTTTINSAADVLMQGSAGRLRAAPTVEGISGFSAAALVVRVQVTADPTHLAEQTMAVRAGLRQALLGAGIVLA
ncbi:MAG: mechanosensitive ion channel [Armatimonadetes bacterium]|nr:mechanosensitive ion channel [Armatimonadota bacterium]MDE2207721.1 mechanosensitive ion channel [Armatimonadota bacterium]